MHFLSILYEDASDAMYLAFIALLALLWWRSSKPNLSYEKFFQKEFARLCTPSNKFEGEDEALAKLALEGRDGLEVHLARSVLDNQNEKALSILGRMGRHSWPTEIVVPDAWSKIEAAAEGNEVAIILLNEYREHLFKYQGMPQSIHSTVNETWLRIEPALAAIDDNTRAMLDGDEAAALFSISYTALALDYYELVKGTDKKFSRTGLVMKTLKRFVFSPTTTYVDGANMLWSMCYEVVQAAKYRGLIDKSDVENLISMLPKDVELIELLEASIWNPAQRDYSELGAETAKEYLTTMFQMLHKRPKSIANWIADLNQSEKNELDLISKCIDWLRANPGDFFEPKAAKRLLDQRLEGLTFASETLESAWLDQAINSMRMALMILPYPVTEETPLPTNHPMIRVEYIKGQVTCRWRESHSLNLKCMCGGHLIDL